MIDGLPERCCARCGFSACNPEWLKTDQEHWRFRRRLHLDVLGARATVTCYRRDSNIVYALDRCGLFETIDDVTVTDGLFHIRGQPIGS